MIPPLAIVQARIGSKRLPGKMLMDLGGKPLVYWAWNAARVAFGVEHTVAAIPASAANDELAGVVEGWGGQVFRWAGDESDVLGRFHACAHRYRWRPDSVIVRVTPDDPFKSAVALARVAMGERLPVEFGGEAFTLAMLDEWHEWGDGVEHLTHLYEYPPPPPPPGVWTIDTQEQLDQVREIWANAEARMWDVDLSSVTGALA